MRLQAACLIVLMGVPSVLRAEEPAKAPKDSVVQLPGSERTWKLVWSDEFDGAGLPDPAKWGYEVGMLRNREAQFYTEARKENTRVENGQLIIEARKEPFRSAKYTAGSLKSKADWKDGRIEVRAKLPTGRGMWPAIWMLPTSRKLGWPACGEIDIMENVGFEPDTIHGTVHTKTYNHMIGTQKGGTTKTDKPYDAFHVYAIEWDQKKIGFFVDAKKYFTFKNEGTGTNEWPFDQAFHIKLNIAVGGAWGGAKGIDDSIFPQRFVIDYVRVYQETPAGK